MSEKNHNIDHEATNLQQEDFALTEEEYFIAVMNSVSELIISDEFYHRNRQLIHNITNDFRDRHIRQGDMPPRLAGRSVEIFFSGISKFGFR